LRNLAAAGPAPFVGSRWLSCTFSEAVGPRAIRCPAAARGLLGLAILTSILTGGSARADEAPLLLQRPTLSATQIVFVFADDLWSVPRIGGAARRLTNTPGPESAPAFSPDGAQVAFTAERGGNFDVFVMPASGGTPRRLTFHPELDLVVGWTPDRRRVLFASRRGRNQRNLGPLKLYTISVEGGHPEEVPLPVAGDASFSPEGKRLVYTSRGHFYFNTRKRYRGGSTSRIMLAVLKDSSVEPLPQQRNSNDFRPMWAGDAIYFLSDRDGSTTLFRYDPARKRITRAVENRGFDLKWASAGPGAIIYEQFGSLHLYDLKSGQVERVLVHIDEDLPKTLPRVVKVNGRFDAVSVSPESQVVAQARGEILAVNAATGKSTCLTNTPGIAERNPAWSPDGKWIAYFSDESGGY
jgi:tricorn protease